MHGAIGIKLAIGGLVCLIGLFVLAVMMQVAMTAQQHIAVGKAGDAGWIRDWVRESGWYGREKSKDLPGSSGTEATTYRWTAGRATVELSPLLRGVPYELWLRTLSQGDGMRAAGMRVAVGNHV